MMPLQGPEMPLRSPAVQRAEEGAERGCWESWRSEYLCSEKRFRASLIQMSPTRAEMCSRGRRREHVEDVSWQIDAGGKEFRVEESLWCLSSGDQEQKIPRKVSRGDGKGRSDCF